MPRMGGGSQTGSKRPLPTTEVAMEKALAVLSAHKREWAELIVPERIALIDELRAGFERVQERWIRESLAAKGLGFWLKRPEDYYGEPEDETLPEDIDESLR